MTDKNPFLGDWPPAEAGAAVREDRPEHFVPAYERAFAEHDAEIADIAGSNAAPDFANTIEALERSGRALERVENVFHLLAGAHTNDALLEIEREIAPRIAAHWNRIHTNAVLFGRIDALAKRSDSLGLGAEQSRVLERYHVAFRRAGAALDGPAKKRLAEILERLGALGTPVSQNVLRDEQRTER